MRAKCYQLCKLPSAPECRKLLHHFQIEGLSNRIQTRGSLSVVLQTFGLISIGSNRGRIPEILDDGRRGIVVEPGNVGQLSDALAAISRDPVSFQDMSLRAAAWAQRYTLGGLQDALRNILEETWEVSLGR